MIFGQQAMNFLNPALDWIDFIAYDGQDFQPQRLWKKLQILKHTYIFLYFSTIKIKKILKKGSVVERLILQTIYVRNKKIRA